MKFHPFVLLLCLSPAACQAQGNDAFDPVRAFLNDSVEDGTVAGGSVLVCHEGEIVFQTGFGFSDLEEETPFEVGTPVIVASISKPMLGTTLHQLAEAGSLDLAAPVTDYLPEFRNRKLESGEALTRPPTVGELFTHSSGLRHDSARRGRIWFQDWTRGQSLQHIVNKVATDFPFVRQPGTRFAYSGIGTDVAARVGEVASGQLRNQMLRTHLCEPLEMEQTFYLDTAGLQRLGLPMPTRYLRDKDSGKLRPSSHRPPPEPNRYCSSGGSIVSTTHDLLKWLSMIRDKGLHRGDVFLREETVTAMLTESRYGKIAAVGLFVRARNENDDPVRYGHTGSSGTNVWIDFETDTIGIMLTQTRGSDIKPFRLELERRVGEAVSSLN